MIGAQASMEQVEKILSYFDIGRKEGAKVLCGGERAKLPGELANGFHVQPTIFQGHNKMRVFQEEIFGPVVALSRRAPLACPCGCSWLPTAMRRCRRARSSAASCARSARDGRRARRRAPGRDQTLPHGRTSRPSMPARRAASRPSSVSSNTAQAAGSTESRRAASRNTSGSGLCRCVSSAVTIA